MQNRIALAIAAILLIAAAHAAPDDLNRTNAEINQSRQTALTRAAKRISPSIVSIGAERVYLIRRGVPLDQLFFPFAHPAPQYQRARQKTPYLGSGIVIDSEGHVVTNYHVIEGADRIFVTPPDGKEHEAKLVDADVLRDIAILKIDAKDLTSAPLADSDTIMLGEWVLAVGNPYGALLDDPSPTITAGVVSATNRFFRSTGRTPRLYEGMIQTDAAVNPGNSGGALVNALGEVVGVNTFIFSESGGSVGIGFAIPINRVKSMMEEIRRYGKLREARLDFEVTDITQRIQYYMSLSSREGVLIHRVEQNGPAQRAGLRPGDVILSVNKRTVNNRRDLLVHILGEAVGSSLTFRVRRGNQTFETQYETQAQD